jgi:hypothetical protein
VAKVKYCKRRDNTKSAVQVSVKLRLVRALMKAQIPRDAISQNLPIPETTTIGTPLDKSLGPGAGERSTVKARLRPSTCRPLCDGSPD